MTLPDVFSRSIEPAYHLRWRALAVLRLRLQPHQDAYRLRWTPAADPRNTRRPTEQALFAADDGGGLHRCWADGFSAGRRALEFHRGVLADLSSSRPHRLLVWDQERVGAGVVMVAASVPTLDHHTTCSSCGHPVRTRTRARQDPP